MTGLNQFPYMHSKLTLDMVGQTQQNSTNPMDWSGICPILTYRPVGLMNPCFVCLTISRVRLGRAKCPTSPKAGGVLLCLTNHIKGLGYVRPTPPTSPWVGGFLL
jgi:hypothetical protein